MPPQQVSTTTVEGYVLLLVVATFVSVLTRRIHLPYTVTLVVVGILIGHSHWMPGLQLSRDLVLLIFLPPLLFEGTLAMDLRVLLRNWREVSILSLGVTAMCFVALGAAAHVGLGYSWPYALLVGAILSPTDPVSVLALMRESGVTRRLSLLIEAESCFNDGIGVVLFLIVTAAIAGQPVTLGGACWLFVSQALGGLAVGALLGYAVHRLLGRLDDHLTETMISVALAYGAYVLAERFHLSGIMAVIAGGLVIGNYGKSLAMSEETRVTLSSFWEVGAFLANSVLFLLMGMALQAAPMWPQAGRIVAAFAFLIVSRQVIVLVAVRGMRALGCSIPQAWDHFIGWAGVRGSIPIALALGIAPSVAGPGVPSREEMVPLMFGVVLLSLVVQGLTIRPLLLRLGLGQGEEASGGAPHGG